MFEPDSFWEKRVAILENLVVEAVDSLPTGSALVDRWARLITQLKKERAMHYVQPNVEPGQMTDLPFIQQVFELNFGDAMLGFTQRSQRSYATAQEAPFGSNWTDYYEWLHSLPDFGSELRNFSDLDKHHRVTGSFYQDTSADGRTSFIYVFQNNSQLIAISFDKRVQVMALQTIQIDKPYMRSEMYPYLEDAFQSEFLAALANAYCNGYRMGRFLHHPYVGQRQAQLLSEQVDLLGIRHTPVDIELYSTCNRQAATTS